MRKLLFTILFLTIIVYGDNLLQNPSFETWDNDTTPTGWVIATSGFRIAQEEGTFHSGTFSGYVTLRSTSTQRIEQYVDVEPLLTYYCSLWVWQDDPHVRTRIYIRWYDSTGSQISSTSSGYSDPDSMHIWQLLTVDAQAPDGADTAHFEIRFYDVAWGDSIDSSMCHIDDAFMGLPANIPPAIGSFERFPIIPRPSVNQTISAIITDDGSVASDTLYYSTDGSSFSPVTHDSLSGTRYYYTIPGQSGGTAVYYFVRAMDNLGVSSGSDTLVYRVYPPATDTVKNSGFESWQTDSIPEFWNIENANYVKVTKSTNAYSGTYSAKLERIVTNHNSGIYQKIKVDPFDTVVVSAWFFDNDPDVRARLWFTWYLWDGSYTNNFDGYTVDSSGWQMLSDTIIAPDMADTLSIRIRLYTEGGDSLGVVYLDGVSAIPYGIDEPVPSISKNKGVIIGSTISLILENPGIHNIKITDITGRVLVNRIIHTETKDERVIVNTGNLKRGVYFIINDGSVVKGIKIE